ncbi:SMP-30/gluconolactonase/LRE family protein [Pelagibacterium halotolerans]|uniref:SMP-30/gluconolactonase/LRE family protein n=1 Tax=Pelagibacterium halotolerans TaxID=531813 RepID=UPI00384E7E1A
MSAQLFDDRDCFLGEGPLWHPTREQLFWFDIVNKTLLTAKDGKKNAWTFDEMVSAAGWLDDDRLVIASETGFLEFNIETGEHKRVGDLEADMPLTRSNDGRADPWGGFWIGTMGKKAEPGAGAIYRYYRGEVRRLFPDITIPNAISFAPDKSYGQFADTDTSIVYRVALDPEHGWPVGEPGVFLDLAPEHLNPDGAVIDASGLTWIAQWGAARVAAYAPDGQFVEAIGFPAPHTSCPAFGGPDLAAMFCTTAKEGLDAAALERHPQSGMTFVVETHAKGQAEHQVIL